MTNCLFCPMTLIPECEKHCRFCHDSAEVKGISGLFSASMNCLAAYTPPGLILVAGDQQLIEGPDSIWLCCAHEQTEA